MNAESGAQRRGEERSDSNGKSERAAEQIVLPRGGKVGKGREQQMRAFMNIE
jgi:hypothetical protein